MPTITLQDDIESGLGNFPNTFFGGAATGTAAVDQSHSPTHSMKLVTFGAGDAAYLSSGDAICADAGTRTSTWVRHAGAPVTNDMSMIVTFQAGFGNAPFLLALTTAGKLRLYHSNNFTAGAAGSTTVAANTWTRIAMSWVITSGSNWTCKVYINGALEFTRTQADATLTQTGTSEIAGVLSSIGAGVSEAMTVWLDDFYVDAGTDLADPLAGTPFVPMEFPNPKGKFAYPLRGDVWGMSSPLRDSIVTAPIPPGASVEWNPPRSKPYPVELRTFLSFYVIDNSQPFSTTEWPNPSLKRRASTGDMGPLTALNIATAIVTPPIGQSDMGRPQPPGLNRDLRGYTDASEFWMLKDTMFGAQGEPLTPMPEPLPRVKGVTIDLKTWVQNLLLSTLNLPVFAPRVMHDWPVPRVQFYSPALRTWTQSPSLLLKDKIYGAAGEVPAYDWPLPKIGRRVHGDQWVQNLLESTLTPPPAFKPWWAANTNRAVGPLIEPR